MPGPIEQFLSDDHASMDDDLSRVERPDGTIDEALFAVFREKLLRHIGMEEKVLLRAARDVRGEPLPIAKQLRRDHGTIAALLVPSPTPEGCAKLREVLARHNPLEEGPEGVYAECERILGDQVDEVLDRMKAQPKVPVATYYDGPLVHKLRDE